jgi:hypothetical protein
MYTKGWSEHIERTVTSVDLGIDGKIILNGILKRLGVRVWAGYM